MRILHVCRSDAEGGAAIAMRRLHDALVASGVDSRVMVISKAGADPRISAPLGWRGEVRVRAFRAVASRVAAASASNEPREMRSFGLAPTGLGRAIAASGADLVHLHWVGGETMSLGEIAAIRQPLVWTLHDEWPFSGVAHFAPTGPAAARRRPDLDGWTFRRKRRLWQDLDVGFVCPSRWIARRLADAPLFADAPRTVIPNTLDPEVFVPGDRAALRRELGLPDGPVLLFGAVGGARDPRKGGDLLARVIAFLAGRVPALTLAVFGGPAPDGLPLQAVELGVVRNTAELARIYAAADVFICPSQIDNLPNTVLEAQCCGTPAVGFAAGGLAEAIGTSERVAPPFDCAALAGLVAGLLEEPADPAEIRAATLARIAPERVAGQHVAFYRARLRKPAEG